MKIDLIIFLVCLVGLGGYLYYNYTHTAHPKAAKEQIISQVQVNGKIAKVNNVKVVEIPQETYDSMTNNPKWKEHLSGNKKRVLLVTWDGCPYNRAFKQALQKVFKFPKIGNFYIKDIILTGQEITVRCEGDLPWNCPMKWIMDHCANRICIINPKTHEAIIDGSSNTDQVLPILAAYAQWDAEPLLGN